MSAERIWSIRMELGLSPSDIAFREEVRAFLKHNLTPSLRAAAAAVTGTFSDIAAMEAWHTILWRKGWVAPAWPVEFGGPGWNEVQRYIFTSECALAGVPSTFAFGILMCGPILMRFGTEDQKATYLPRILSGADRWCQGYSEPGSGSDLASLQTVAYGDGNDYIVNGTKIWTTFAHLANRIFCLVRTDRAVKPQRGISFLLIDMASPGITIRPIVNIAGDHEFNQVFFDNVRVPKANRVGEEGQGWTVAKYLLEFERGATYSAGLWAQLDRIKRLTRFIPVDDAAIRTRIAKAEIDILAVEMSERRTISALSLGDSPGASASMLKLQGSELSQRLEEVAIDAIGGRIAMLPAGDGLSCADSAEASVIMARYLYGRAVTIFGGTSEVQRNILARGVLGL
jgi:acyl-CoA dehydrogenase